MYIRVYAVGRVGEGLYGLIGTEMLDVTINTAISRYIYNISIMQGWSVLSYITYIYNKISIKKKTQVWPKYKHSE